jgi:hypothetical protein
MFKKKDVFIISGIVTLFAIGLVGFFVFSAPDGDGLENTMEQAEVEEDEAVYTAPLDYGDNYPLSLSIGLLGFAVTLFIVFIVSWILRKKDATQHS